MTDWFLPAVQHSGSVKDCLEVVIRIEDERAIFTKSLSRSLCDGSGLYSDAITATISRLVDLRKTLDLRLGLMLPDSHQAWFRENTAELGPFPGNVNSAPLLFEFAPSQALKIRNELLSLWKLGTSSSQVIPAGSTLWSQLLMLNESFEKTCQLAPPFDDLRLDELPESLPDHLSTPALLAFLNRVQVLAVDARESLNTVFQKFFHQTEIFLRNYHKQHSQYYRKQQQNRHSAVGSKPLALQSSLQFMNFQGVPDLKALKRRYFELAKTYHPDAPRGNSDRFQTLRDHYNRIAASLGSAPRP
ncbi:MAG: J domain-containing protein [Pseudobacteriovorax sp.]|nr:J domain-containing protein [Pseudobacteriovorax sp.]